MQTDTDSPQTDEPSLDTTLRLLRDPRRRALVSILADGQPPVSLTDLAAAVAARESGTDADAASDDAAEVPNDTDEVPNDPDEVPNDADEVPPEEADAVAATLHHVHLPKLAAAGLVTYDAEQKTVIDSHVEAVGPFSNLSDDLDC